MRLGDNAFFNLFSRLAAASNRDRDRDQWEVEGVQWRRQRHVHWSALSFQIVTHELERKSRRPWKLLLVHETWWGRDRSKTIRNSHWVHLAAGARSDALAWFAARERELD